MKYIRRLMFFISTRLVIITLVAALLVCAFYMAYNMGNAYILVSEGMQKRVEVCLTRQDFVELNKYFTADFLNRDPVLAVSTSNSSPYAPYTVTSFDYDIDISNLQAWPWQDQIVCTVTDYVTKITGSVKPAYAQSVDSSIPEWSSGRFRVYLTKQADGSWRISGLTQDANYRDTSR